MKGIKGHHVYNGEVQYRDGRYPNFPGIGYQGHLTRKVSGIIDIILIFAMLDT